MQIFKHPKHLIYKISFFNYFNCFNYFLVLSLLMLLLANSGAFAVGTNKISGNTQNVLGAGSGMLNRNSSPVGMYLPSSSQQKLTRSSIVTFFAIKRDYEFILFYRTDCQYCMKFDPVLKLYSNNTGILVKAFVIGSGDGEAVSPFFPNSIMATRGMVDKFFSHFFYHSNTSAKVVVPALFLLNKSNLHVYPVSSGALTYLELTSRMNELAPKILQNEKRVKKLEEKLRKDRKK